MRNFQLTDAGVALINASTSPVIVDHFVLGTGVNYVPSPADTNIHGSPVFTGPVASPDAINANIIRYTIAMDYDIGDFQFGEVGLFVGSTLFALGVNDKLISKKKINAADDYNAIRIDSYLSMVGTNYNMWGDLSDSSNRFRCAVLESVDYLPMSKDATPNMYIVKGLAANQSAFIAYTDRNQLWNFDCYAYSNTLEAPITGFTDQSISISLSKLTDDLKPLYFGHLIAQFETGAIATTCRNIANMVISGDQVTYNFATKLAITPALGDVVRFFSRQALSVSSIILPIASATTLGGVKIGNGIDVESDGTISVDPAVFPVTSVNGMTGDVLINANNLPGLARVAITGEYRDLLNKPPAYNLPIASQSVLGGVKAPPSVDKISIDGTGVIDLTFDPVKSVNNQVPDASGNVTLPIPTIPQGLIDAQPLTNQDLNTLKTVGLFFALAPDAPSIPNNPNTSAGAFTLEVVPYYASGGNGDVVQRATFKEFQYWRASDGTQWGAWKQVQTPSALPIATTTTLGTVIVGTGLNITPLGVLTTQIQKVNGKNDQDIQLNASDVGAVAITQVGVPGGVGTLTAPNPADPAELADQYSFGREPSREIALDVWHFTGHWDASINQVDGISGPPTTNPSGAAIPYKLDQGGMADVVIPDNGQIQQNTPVPGNAYIVTVAGTTSLDGISNWAVGDIAISVDGKWRKIPLDLDNIIFSAGTY